MSMRISRRGALAGAAGGFFAYACRHHAEQLFAAAPTGRAKRCVVLWMNGGPSQMETFDPKPGTANGGPVKSIATAVPGLAIAETLPQIATRMDRLSVVRNLTSPEGEHLRAQYYLHTGHRLVPSFPRPALGAMVSHATPATDFPRFVTVGNGRYGPAFLGPDHGPFTVGDPDEALRLLRTIRRRRDRLSLIRELGSDFRRERNGSDLARREGMLAQIESLVATPFVEALNVEREPETVRRKYGDHEFGRGCLLARRLLESGVRFVEVQHDGWDTHSDNFASVQRLCEAVDGPWAQLMDDLKSSGLLDETVVVWMGEFGRTPNINGNQGRDHFPKVTPAVVGGGPIQGGRVVGATNNSGSEIVDDSRPIPDLFATLLSALGIAPDRQYTTSFGSPTAATDDGRVIDPLLK